MIGSIINHKSYSYYLTRVPLIPSGANGNLLWCIPDKHALSCGVIASQSVVSGWWDLSYKMFRAL